MKKGILRGIFSILISFCLCIAMTGCDWPWSKTDEPPIEPSVWTIQYTDDEGTHQLKVEEGMPFSIENIPAREGYDFLGLFDAEVGGTQYVSAKGASLSIYTDKRNLVLFPQWQAKKYTLQLNYGNAPDAGIDRVEVSYDGEIQGLPEDFYIEGSEFIGWYNTQDASGTKFANGTVMNKSLAALADENNYIALYAVLDTAQYTVRFYSYDGNSLIEEKRVAHGSDITEVAPQTLSDGSEITSWSTSKNGYGNEYRGEITTDMDFYMRDFRYVLTLDYGYGNQKDVIRVNRGGSCTLPDISRERYIFDGWYESGTRVNKQYTPERSATLTARWTANFYTVSFNTNGGSSISAREVERGETTDLPSASREGYIFNYWKTSSGTRVSSPYKPTGNITLYADWTAEKCEVYHGTIRTGTKKINRDNETRDTFTLTMDLESMKARGFAKLSISVDFAIAEVDNCGQHFELYDSQQTSIYKDVIYHGGNTKKTSWETHSFHCEIALTSIKSTIWTLHFWGDNVIFHDYNLGTISVSVTALP